MTKGNFESAVKQGAEADAKDGTKWDPLKKLFAAEQLRGNATISNSPAERTTRARQLATTLKHPGFNDRDYSRYGVFVLGAENTAKDISEPTYLNDFVVPSIVGARPDLPPTRCLESVLILRYETNGELTPRALLKWGDSDITSGYSTWYPGLDVRQQVVVPLVIEPDGAPLQLDTQLSLPSADDSCELLDVDGAYLIARTALLAGKHVVLYGPPGSGKTELAEYLCQTLIAQPAGAFDFVCATSDWTTFDTIGGYLPAPDGTGVLQFAPGIMTRAIQQARWLIVDEMNRADIDKAFGELFTLLSGKTIRIPFQKRVGDKWHAISIGPKTGATDTDEIPVPLDWRMIGTMNTFDKSSLFQLSYAFMRRFAFVEVPVPGVDSYTRLITDATAELANCSDVVKGAITKILTDIFVPAATNQLTALGLTVGPAIPLDIIRVMARALPSLPTQPSEKDAQGLLFEAVCALLLPQFDGKDRHHQHILDTLVKLFSLDAESRNVLERRLTLWTGYTPPDNG